MWHVPRVRQSLKRAEMGYGPLMCFFSNANLYQENIKSRTLL